MPNQSNDNLAAEFAAYAAPKLGSLAPSVSDGFTHESASEMISILQEAPILDAYDSSLLDRLVFLSFSLKRTQARSHAERLVAQMEVHASIWKAPLNPTDEAAIGW